MTIDELSNIVIGAAIEVHRELGPGLLESVYQQCLARELEIRGIPFSLEQSIDIQYKGIKLEANHRLDVLVAEQIALELKVVEKVLAVHEAQLLSYLRLTNKRLGLLLNFHVPVMRQGIRRVVNNL